MARPGIFRPPSAAERRGLYLWTVVLAIYVALGVWKPPVFLLGFWESMPIVLLATLAIGALRRRARR